MRRRRKLVAPYDVIQDDFRELDAVTTLRTTWDTERLILIQSVQGHAHEGHAAFCGERYPNTSIDDVSRALRLDPAWVRSERQKLIGDIECYVDRVLAGDDKTPLTNDDGEELLGSSMFRDLRVSGRDVLRGIYLGGLRDDPEYRFDMEARYGTSIGGGKCYLVDTEVMDEMGLNGDILAHGAHEDMIDFYRDRGLIVSNEGKDGDGIEYMYIRHRRGPGGSDDTAVVAAGMLYNLGVAVGVFLADAIDTLEKYVPVFSDQDGNLAKKIGAGFPKLNISDAEVRHLAYLSAIPAAIDIPVPDCSLRYMILINRKHDLTPAESHLLHVRGRRCAQIRIGPDEVRNDRFYHYVRQRIHKSPGVL